MTSRLPLSDAACTLTTLAAAYALKRFYSVATPADLDWLLAPTAAVASVLTGTRFVAEGGVGYVSRELHTAIVPPCAGVNYLLIAVCTLVFGFVRTWPTAREKAVWCLVSTGLGYVTTVVVNGARVALGIGVHRAAFAASLSPAGVHRALGVAVYLTSLWGLFAAVATWKHANTALKPVVAPVFWYLAVTLVLPALNGATTRVPFRAHALEVLLVAGALLALRGLLGLRIPRIAQFPRS